MLHRRAFAVHRSKSAPARGDLRIMGGVNRWRCGWFVVPAPRSAAASTRWLPTAAGGGMLFASAQALGHGMPCWTTTAAPLAVGAAASPAGAREARGVRLNAPLRLHVRDAGSPAPGGGGQHGGHDDRVVRLLPLRHGGCAGLSQALFPWGVPVRRCAGVVRH